MPVTNNIAIEIDGQLVDLGDLQSTGIKINYLLNEPDSFETKGSASSLSISVPVTKKNDQIFNTFRNPEVSDMTSDNSFRGFKRCNVSVNGVLILRGWALLESASQIKYTFSIWGNNGDWLILLQNTTLWDCLSNATHTFDLATVQSSWGASGFGGYDANENKDFVYAPVRYRQPFGENDDAVSIFHLRPSLSIYWMLIRGFRQAGYTVKSDFLNSSMFRRLVLPWVWGDFYDLEGSIVDGIKFKAAGPNPPQPPGYYQFWTGTPFTSEDTRWLSDCAASGESGLPASGTFLYIKSQVGSMGTHRNFRMGNDIVPNGFDNFGLYSFDESTGTMRWVYNPPAYFSGYLGNNITANFQFSLIAINHCVFGHHNQFFVEIRHIHASGAPDTLTDIEYDTLSNSGGGDKGTFLTPTPFKFSVSGIYQGDTLEFKLKLDTDSNSNYFRLHCSNWLNTTYGMGSTTAYYQKQYSTFSLTSLQVSLGGTVNFKLYDKFKSYKFFDLLRGLVDAFDLEIQTDPLARTVMIEPFSAVTIPTYDQFGNITGTQVIDGYFKHTGAFDYTQKLDDNKEHVLQLFSDYERQIDFSFKQDGSDGGANIFTARYKGVNLGAVRDYSSDSSTGLISAVPGASRYLLPNRFPQGNRQKTNRFFAASLHYIHQAWANIFGTGTPAPQLMTIFPENISDSSASTITQTFEPRLAFYRGQQDPSVFGGWRFIGDPAAPYPEVFAHGFNLPVMFSVNYGYQGDQDPVLSYSDQMIGGNVVPGLMRKYFLRRLAIMRNGQLYSPYLRLNLNDLCNWTHREPIRLKNSMFGLIGIEGYNTLADDASQCRMWKLVSPKQEDVDNSYPSATSVTSGSTLLPSFDLKYAPLILYPSDLPQVNG